MVNLHGRTMKVLVLGANGRTGYHVVKQLLENEIGVKALVRNPIKLESLQPHKNLEIIIANILAMDTIELSDLLSDVDAVVSCLGHNVSFKGLWGEPHRLVTDAVKKTCEAIHTARRENVIKFILMNTTACRSKEREEQFSFAEQIIMGIMRVLLPPHRDNEEALAYLQEVVGKGSPALEWVAVRPDGLIDEDRVTKYTVHPSPNRSPIFNAGKTSRINVGHFMMTLLRDPSQWDTWKYQMPVIYNEMEPLPQQRKTST